MVLKPREPSPPAVESAAPFAIFEDAEPPKETAPVKRKALGCIEPALELPTEPVAQGEPEAKMDEEQVCAGHALVCVP